MNSSFVAKSMERQHLKSVRKLSLQIVDINTALKDVHQQLAPHIDEIKYEAATGYVNQYISHTHVWNIKFVCNLEDPEVALMQLFHLKYILDREPAELYKNARSILEEQRQKFLKITLYSNEHIEMRRTKMLDHIMDFEKIKGER
ncbi:hypothetical protein [Solibacillus daqui]|uniref:hypothetical protein n=1 Tax=Solibacillus daqui TaxID=2912187 RepID=UPI002365BAD1|nr:hypothetical protein [Solibacillus daqui]